MTHFLCCMWKRCVTSVRAAKLNKWLVSLSGHVPWLLDYNSTTYLLSQMIFEFPYEYEIVVHQPRSTRQSSDKANRQHISPDVTLKDACTTATLGLIDNQQFRSLMISDEELSPSSLQSDWSWALHRQNAGSKQLGEAIKSHSSEQNTEWRASIIKCANEAII